MRNLDFTSWQTLVSTLVGIALVTLLGVGLRLVAMQTIQQRRERQNRQVNERLRVLIAAYKTLGGSFTGDLHVDPRHLRDIAADAAEASNERGRRMRDAVEAALSDILLLGTEEQVRLAARAAGELSAGRSIHTAELVVSLRRFIRAELRLEAVPANLPIPPQGPTRPAAGGGGRGGDKGSGGSRGGGGGGGGGGMGGGMGIGLGTGLGLGAHTGGDGDPGGERP